MLVSWWTLILPCIGFSIPETPPESPDITRRRAIGNFIFAASAPAASSSLIIQPAHAEDLSTTSITPNIWCLKDLPPLEPDHVRIFMCRHGQTENNRLRKVQGARVDPPLNDTGIIQSIRLGKVFNNYFRSTNGGIPKLALHSKLIRARETARIASLTMGRYRDPISKYDSDMEISDFDFIQNIIKNYDSENSVTGVIDLQTRHYLNEVDFGSLEGNSVKLSKATMMYTFGRWGIGQIDAKNDGGESGRSVVMRASNALLDLKDIAISNQNCMIAFTHSTYLRVLLAIALDVSLLDTARMDINNCSISVLDVHMNETRQVDYRSNIFGGEFLSLAPKDFSVIIPIIRVVRINENRHLIGLQ